MNIKKIIYSILVEIKKGENVPSATDYGLNHGQFADIAKIIKDEKYADNVAIAAPGENAIVWLDNARITMKGIEYIEQNNILAKTYKGLKEIRDWLKP